MLNGGLTSEKKSYFLSNSDNPKSIWGISRRQQLDIMWEWYKWIRCIRIVRDCICSWWLPSLSLACRGSRFRWDGWRCLLALALNAVNTATMTWFVDRCRSGGNYYCFFGGLMLPSNLSVGNIYEWSVPLSMPDEQQIRHQITSSFQVILLNLRFLLGRCHLTLIQYWWSRLWQNPTWQCTETMENSSECQHKSNIWPHVT